GGTGGPGQQVRGAGRAIGEENWGVCGGGPTDDELERCRVQAEAQFMFRLQSVGGFGGKSDQLNAYNIFLGDPNYFERDLARYRHVTARSLQDALIRYIRHQRRGLAWGVARRRGAPAR